MKYVKGEIITIFDSKYLVEDIYQLTDEEIQKHNLIHRSRVRLKEISGENGGDIMDFAISNGNK